MNRNFDKYLWKSLNEMVHIGSVKTISIDVYDDHGFPHFHITKKDCYEAKVKIKDLKVFGYNWQQDGKELKGREYMQLLAWLEKDYTKGLPKNYPKISNLLQIQMQWNIMNQNNQI